MTRIHRPSPATLIAFVALFVALGGPSQAAQLAKKVTGQTSRLRGPRGPRGPAGFAKPPIVRAGQLRVLPGSGIASGTASCRPKEVATGGGVNAGSPIMISAPFPAIGVPTAWLGEVAGTSSNPGSGGVFVLCVARR